MGKTGVHLQWLDCMMLLQHLDFMIIVLKELHVFLL